MSEVQARRLAAMLTEKQQRDMLLLADVIRENQREAETKQ